MRYRFESIWRAGALLVDGPMLHGFSLSTIQASWLLLILLNPTIAVLLYLSIIWKKRTKASFFHWLIGLAFIVYIATYAIVLLSNFSDAGKAQ